MAAQRPGLTQALGRMQQPLQLSALEATHNAYDVFIFTLEALASPAESQCELRAKSRLRKEPKEAIQPMPNA